MAEQMLVFRSPERFATMAANGAAMVWQVGSDGIPYQLYPPSPVTSETVQALSGETVVEHPIPHPPKTR